MNISKKTIVLTELCIAIAIFVILPAAFILSADPCHVFHKPLHRFLQHGFTPETRCQNAGLINSWLADVNEGFDSILVGASTSGNFLIPYINQKTQWKKTLKLTMVNMFPVEQNIIVNRSIATGNVQHVFWEIVPMLHHAPTPYDFSNIAKSDFLPAYLYNNSRLDDYRYIFNAFTFSGAVDILTNKSYFVDDINKINYIENRCTVMHICDLHMSRSDIENIKKKYTVTNRSIKSPSEKSSIAYRDFDNFIYPVIKEYCNQSISFDFFFSPFSMLWFGQLSDKEFDFELYLLRHAIEKTYNCNNVRIFAFYNELWITGDLSNYSDPKHFYGNIHNYIIDSIANNKHRVTLDNIDEFENSMVRNMNDYRPYGTILEPH